jgi:TfoX N-terminal domain
MPFDESLGRRVAAALDNSNIEYAEKRMFGGLGFTINEKMCIGVVKDDLMVRVLDEKIDEVLAMPNVRPMDFTGRPMKGFIFVEPAGIPDSGSLMTFVDLGAEFGKFGKVKTKKKAG